MYFAERYVPPAKVSIVVEPVADTSEPCTYALTLAPSLSAVTDAGCKYGTEATAGLITTACVPDGMSEVNVIDEGLRAYMLKVYNYMASGILIT